MQLRDPATPNKSRHQLHTLGEMNNTIQVDAAIHTRLHVVVKAGDNASATKLQTAGVAGLSSPPPTLHLIVGLNADQHPRKMQAQMA